jgi:hypothetical protein
MSFTGCLGPRGRSGEKNRQDSDKQSPVCSVKRFQMARHLLRRLVHLLPEGLGARVLRTWRLRRFWIRRLRFRLSASISARRYLSDDTVYWVDPDRIVYAMNSEGFYQATPTPGNRTNCEFNVYEYKGAVLGGDWDGLERKFSELDFYRSYQERAEKGASWEQLPYYRRVLGQIESGTEKWGCRSKQDLHERCSMLDRLFNDIRQNGYKGRALQRKERGKDGLLDADDEITVNVGRYGDLIFNNGRHRLTLAKIAGVEKVPVTITVRHSAWEEFKKEIEVYAKKNNGGVCGPLTHIDLQTIPVHDSHQRFDMIRKNVGEGNSTLLDIGAGWGYFCHRFEEEGFNCTALENDPENLYFLKKLRRGENRNFEVVPESILALSEKAPLKYDIVLALNIFDHLLKEKTSLEDLRRLLHCLDMNEMYFEAHDEPQMEGAFTNSSPEEFAGFLLGNSCLNSYKLIGQYEAGKAIYRLWR